MINPIQDTWSLNHVVIHRHIYISIQYAHDKLVGLFGT